MPDNTLTDLTLVIDRSGSMGAIRGEAQLGINAFIQGQSHGAGDARLTLMQFDTEYECVHSGVPIEEVPRYVLRPRGATALLDAVGRTISEVGGRLASMPEPERPGLVVFVIVTDGQENSSLEYTRSQVREMIRHQREVYSWEFVFLGVDDGAFHEAQSIGIDSEFTARYDRLRSRRAYDVIGNKCVEARACLSVGAAADMAFSDDERAEMTGQES